MCPALCQPVECIAHQAPLSTGFPDPLPRSHPGRPNNPSGWYYYHMIQYWRQRPREVKGHIQNHRAGRHRSQHQAQIFLTPELLLQSRMELSLLWPLQPSTPVISREIYWSLWLQSLGSPSPASTWVSSLAPDTRVAMVSHHSISRTWETSAGHPLQWNWTRSDSSWNKVRSTSRQKWGPRSKTEHCEGQFSWVFTDSPGINWLRTASYLGIGNLGLSMLNPWRVCVSPE